MRVITDNRSDLPITEAMLYARSSINKWMDEPVWSDGAIITFLHPLDSRKQVLTSTCRTKTGYSVRVWDEPRLTYNPSQGEQ